MKKILKQEIAETTVANDIVRDLVYERDNNDRKNTDVLKKAKESHCYAYQALIWYRVIAIELARLAQTYCTVEKIKRDLSLEELGNKSIQDIFLQLQAEKTSRYQIPRERNRHRITLFEICKQRGMTDAAAYREIIRQEQPSLKPNTAAYLTAMNSLRVWKSRNFHNQK